MTNTIIKKGYKDMERTAIFTITVSNGLYNIKCKAFNQYNQIGVSRDCLFTAMSQLSDVFNNVLKIGICFDIG